MPQVQTDPTLVPGVITNGGTDLFSFPNVQQASILGLQTPSTQPLPPGTDSAVNLLVPDLQVIAQLVNFPGNIYDLSPSSLLVHFMQALLGSAGAGQLRKRQMVARLQQAVTSTRFYDLDSFYGALFGAVRGPSGTLPQNPNTGQLVDPYGDLASPDGWDEIEQIDALFRERVIQLARAITLGGTVPGLQAIGEAISGVPCQVYEIWRLLDNATGPLPGYQTWQQVTAAYPAWNAIPAGTTWQSVEGIVSFTGLLGGGTPTEVVIQPLRYYGSDPASQAQQGADQLGILSVAEVLRPAVTLVSVDTGGPQVISAVQPAAAWSPSQYWELVHLVTPANAADPAYSAITASYQGTNAAELPPGTYATPVPPMSRAMGCQYSFAGDVTTVTARAVTGSGPAAEQVTDGQDFQSVAFPRGGTVKYLPSQAILAPAAAVTARTSSPAAVRSAPYSGPRVPVKRSS
jgi:hypothetical protein